MGFWSDLSMGLGVTPKTQDYVDRTAKRLRELKVPIMLVLIQIK